MLYLTLSVVPYTQCCILHSVLYLTLSVAPYTLRPTNTALFCPQSQYTHRLQVEMCMSNTETASIAGDILHTALYN